MTQLPLRFIFLLYFLMSTNAKLLNFFIGWFHVLGCLFLSLGTTPVSVTTAGIIAMIVPVTIVMTFNLSKGNELSLFICLQ